MHVMLICGIIQVSIVGLLSRFVACYRLAAEILEWAGAGVGGLSSERVINSSRDYFVSSSLASAATEDPIRPGPAGDT